MASPQPITVKLDRDRRVQWSNSARYRLSCLQLRPDGTYATLVAILWACLVPDDAKDFATPEHLAHFIADERLEEFAEISSKLVAQMKGPDEKKAGGSTRAPSRGSSSG